MQTKEIKYTKQGVRDLGGNDKRRKAPKHKDDFECEHPEHQIGTLASGEDYCQLCGQIMNDEG